MRTVAVVMIGVLGQYQPQLPAPEDEHPVQHLPPNDTHRPHRALGLNRQISPPR
jgi:hypothetical protein